MKFSAQLCKLQYIYTMCNFVTLPLTGVTSNSSTRKVSHSPVYQPTIADTKWGPGPHLLFATASRWIPLSLSLMRRAIPKVVAPGPIQSPQGSISLSTQMLGPWPPSPITAVNYACSTSRWRKISSLAKCPCFGVGIHARKQPNCEGFKGHFGLFNL